MSLWNPTWNKKEDENVSCWYCEHFQRYRISGNGYEFLCEGECRKNPPNTFRNNYDSTGAQLNEDERYPFWMQYGIVQWCSGFQRSLEENIPAPPNYGDCNSPPVVDSVTPPQYQGSLLMAKPWSKKPVEESCWHCEHFQRFNENLSTPQVYPCRGWCRISPQDSYVDRIPGMGPSENWQSAFVQITWSTSMWCNRWERSRSPVPAEPDYGQGPCYYAIS